MKNIRNFFLLLLVVGISASACRKQIDPADVYIGGDITNTNTNNNNNIDSSRTMTIVNQFGDSTTTNVIFENGALSFNNIQYMPITNNIHVWQDASGDHEVIVYGDHIWQVTEIRTMQYNGQDVDVRFAEGAISFNNSVYQPITVNAPVYVNLDDNSRIIVYGDNIYNVVNTDNRTIVTVHGDSISQEVNFAEGAISFNNEVYLELDNDWYYNQELDLWIDNSNSNVITQSVRVPVTIQQSQTTNIANRDSCSACIVSPCVGDTIYFEVGAVPFGTRPIYPTDTVGIGSQNHVDLFNNNSIDSVLMGGTHNLTYFSFLGSDALVSINLCKQIGTSKYDAIGVEPYTTATFHIEVDRETSSSSGSNFKLSDPIGSQTNWERKFDWTFPGATVHSNAPLFLTHALSGWYKHFKIRYGAQNTGAAGVLIAIPIDDPARWSEMNDIGVAGKDVTVNFDDGTSATGQ